MASNLVMTMLGHKGSGKSTLVKEIIEDYKRAVVFDTMGEYEPGRGWVVLDNFNDAVRELGRAQDERRFKIAIQLAEDEDALAAMEVAYELRDVLIVFEETSYYCSPSSLPTILKKFTRFGRHREISQIYVSRRPAELHRDLTAQSDIIVSFRQHEPKDVQYIRQLMGKKADSLPSLPKYKALVHSVNGDMGEVPLPILARIPEGHENNQLTIPDLSE